MLASEVSELNSILGYTFSDEALLERAFTHSTACKEGGKDYQVLEFIGDALLDYVVADYLLREFPDKGEDFATRKRSAVVSRYPLAEFFEENKLIRFFRFKNISASQMSPKLKSDVVEAVIGGIYYDGGLEKAREFIENKICSKMIDESDVKDGKSELLEYAAKNKLKVEFKRIEKGADHRKEFYSFVYIDGVEFGSGQGKKKGEADKAACAAALEKLKCTK